MIISEIKLYNFRKFGSKNNEPGLALSFHKGLNALVGENDSGKTAIIDAIKLVLLTQSNEYIKVVYDDFYFNDKGESSKELKIECVISEFTQNEAKNFIEYLTFQKNGESINYTLQLHYRAWKDGNRIYSELKAGDTDGGISIDGKARELLKVVYLRPLRDAEHEMRAGRNSRISQILLSHPLFQSQNEHKLVEIFKDANSEIENYFTKDEGNAILNSIRSNLKEFNGQDLSNSAALKASEIQLKSILESLSLSATEIHPGLGEYNLLFIAAELILLKQDTDGGIRLALIEELEAHLHPQAQLRLINFLQSDYSESGTQIIVSTHSPILASKINIKNITLIKDGNGYDLGEGKTGLEKGDYLFLQRFLDSTKSNLFFAKGIIMVEGDAENILLPVIADILGYPLEKYGISIVNVGSTAFFRYSRILIRHDGSSVGIPVSIITDCDVKPYDITVQSNGTKVKRFNEKNEESEQAIKNKVEKYNAGSIRTFVSPRWTLEYCIALSCFNDEFHRAIYYGKKIFNSDKYALTDAKIIKSDEAVSAEENEWAALSAPERAFCMYEKMLGGNDKSSLKAIAAQCLANILKWEMSEIPDGITMEKMFDIDLYRYGVDEIKRAKLKERLENDQYLKYLVDAIKYAAENT